MGMTKSKSLSFRIVAADHTGITVSNLERSLAFWRDVLGFELSHTAHQTGELAKEITGVAGAEIKLAVVKTPGGHHRVPESDIYDSHDYEQDPARFAANHASLASGKPFINDYQSRPISLAYRGQPYMVSEFGGSRRRRNW